MNRSIHLHIPFPSSAGAVYVSFALSDDEEMGDDSVIECVLNGGNISSFHSWNTERPSFDNTRADVV